MKSLPSVPWLLLTACAAQAPAPAGDPTLPGPRPEPSQEVAVEAPSAPRTRPAAPPRPHDPWVFRSVLDGRARMLTVALAPDLWLAYDTTNGTLARAWSGGVHFDGAVYTTVHGPQPTSEGVDWHDPLAGSRWTAVRAADEHAAADAGPGDELPVRARWRGHRLDHGHVVLLTELSIEEHGRVDTVSVEERPEVVRGEDGRVGLRRDWTVGGLPAGIRLKLTAPGDDAAPRQEYEDGTVYAHAGLAVPATTEQFVVLAETGGLTVRHVPEGGPPTLPTEAAAGSGPGDATAGVADGTGDTQAGGTAEAGAADGRPGATSPVLPELNAPALDEPVAALPDGTRLAPGVSLRIYALDDTLSKLAPLVRGQTPSAHVLLPTLDLGNAEFLASGAPDDRFLAECDGWLDVPRAGRYAFRLLSDDGSVLWIEGRQVIDHDGLHSEVPQDGEIDLPAGPAAFGVRMFEAGGDQALRLQWKPPAADGTPAPADAPFSTVPRSVLRHRAGEVRVTAPGPKQVVHPLRSTRPGDGEPLVDLHPSFRLDTLRPQGWEPRVGGIDALPDGRLAVCTWDARGDVFLLDGAQPERLAADGREGLELRRIATGLAEPLGLKVLPWDKPPGYRIFVLQKQELTWLVDLDGDEVTDEYRCVATGWPVSANFHEFAFGLGFADGSLWANLAVAIDPGGRSHDPQVDGRGSVLRIDPDSGEWAFVANGLRTPNGVGLGAVPRQDTSRPDDAPHLFTGPGPNGAPHPLYVTDNQGDWLPSSKLLLVQQDAFYGNRSVLKQRADGLAVTPPVAWLPQNEIGNSPSQPAPLDFGPWAGQMVVGDVTHGGLKRIAVHEVDGVAQGCVFRFTQGLEAGINRVLAEPGGRFVVGGIGSTGNWGQEGKQRFGLQQLTYTGAPCFELLDVVPVPGGLFVVLTGRLADDGDSARLAALADGRPDGGDALPDAARARLARHLAGLGAKALSDQGTDPDGWLVESWRYEPTSDYGGPKLDTREHRVTAVRLPSPVDRDGIGLVWLEVPDLAPGRVVHLRVLDDLVSGNGRFLWSPEAWLTLNRLDGDSEAQARLDAFGPSEPFAARTSADATAVDGALTEAQVAAGWKPLFDGRSFAGWHLHGDDASPVTVAATGATTLGGWVAQDGVLRLATSGGHDLVTDAAYGDFELELDWRIAPGGNSGLFFRVDETPRPDGSLPATWETGVEMQVLDTARHPDGASPATSAGACYALYAPERDDTRPVGHWNHVRITSRGGHVEQWLNGRLQCAYEVGGGDWATRVAASKFATMPGFSKTPVGRLALQDHGDEVAYRNLRVRGP